MKLEKIIRGCTIGMIGAAMYMTSLATGYTLACHHKVKSLSYYYEAINSYNSGNKEEHEKYLKKAIVHKQKGEKWEELTMSIDLFHKLNLYH